MRQGYTKAIIGVTAGVVLTLLLRLPERLVEHAVFGWIDEQLAGLGGIVSPTVSEVVHFLVAWGLPALTAALAITAIYFLGATYGARHVTPNGRPKYTKVSPSVRPNVEIATADQISRFDQYFSKKHIRIGDLVDFKLRVIEDKTFEDCILYGPAVITFLDKKPMSLQNCPFDGDDDTRYIVLEDGKPAPLGIVGVDGCTFRRCTFIGISIIGRKGVIDYLLSKIGKEC